MIHKSQHEGFDLTWNDVRRDWKAPPNLVSFFRLALATIAWPCILQPGEIGWLGFCLFIVAAATDKLDGWLARRNNGRWITKLGKALDPLVDRLLVFPTLVIALLRCDAQLQPTVILVTVSIVACDSVVALIKAHQPIKSAAQAGRFSMAAKSIAIAMLLMPPVASWQIEATKAFLWIALGSSLCATWIYWTDWQARSRA